MNKDGNNSRLLQDFSVLAANLLPIVQLFFVRLPEGVTKLFLEPKYFTGVSIVTLFLSYVVIIAYQVKPYATLTLPFQRKHKAKYNDYVNKLSELNTARTVEAGEKLTQSKLKKLQQYLETKPVKPPFQISSDNLVSICVGMVAVSGIGFIVLGQLPNRLWFSIIQSVFYVCLIVFSVLVLTLYRKVYASNKEYEYDETHKTARSIQLAIQANSFGLLPQVQYISSFDDNGTFPQTHHVRVKYGDKQYEIVSDRQGKQLFAVYELKSWQI